MLWKLSQLEMLLRSQLTSLHWLCHKIPYGQNPWLVISSSVFYAGDSLTYSSLLLGQDLSIAVPAKCGTGIPWMHI